MNLSGYGPTSLPPESENMEKQDESIKLNDTNWISWLASITGMFYLKNLDGQLEKPTEDDKMAKKSGESQAEFDERTKTANRSVKMAHAVMRMYMTEKYQSLTDHCTTAHETLDLLKSHFAAGEKNKVAINVEKLAALAKDPPPVEELALKIRSYAANIGDTRVNTDDFMVPFFCALAPSKLSDLRIAMQSSTKVTMSAATELVKNELARRTNKKTLAAQIKSKKKEKDDRDDLYCNYCHKKRHTEEKCWRRKGDEKSKSEPKLKVTAIMQKLCAISQSDKDDQSSDIYLDSGSEIHSVNNIKGFGVFQESHNIQLESASGQEIKVRGVGAYDIQAETGTTLRLRQCVYAPSLIANFLSAAKLNDNGMDILLMRDGTWKVVDDDGIVASGVRKNGMYLLSVKESDTAKIAAIGRQSRTIMDWHRSLGHLNFSDLLGMSEKLGIKKPYTIPECKTCSLAKISKRPHKKDKSKSKIESTQPLERIHTDLSGKIRTPAIEGYQYFLTLIDDYSRYLTVFLIKSKQEVYEKFVEFQELVENQFEKKIKKVRSDNGTEYTNQHFVQLFKEKGILHEHTNVESPEENGVAERINRTIGNGVRSSLIDSGMPTRYWPYAVQYITQMQNVSPCSSLDFKTPFELWHGKQFDYKKLHRFGCTCVAKVVDKSGKFGNRGVECRLLCLSTDQNGYTLLRKSDNYIFDSQNVDFFEEDDVQSQEAIVCPDTFEMEESSEEQDLCSTDLYVSEAQTHEVAAAPNTAIENVVETESMAMTETEGVHSANPAVEDLSSNRSVSDQETVQTNGLTANIEANTNVNDRPNDTNQQPEIRYFTPTQFNRFLAENPNAKGRRLVGRSANVVMNDRTVKAGRYQISYINPNKEVLKALKGIEGSDWKKAMDDEHEVLIRNGTFTLTKKPKDARVIKTRWILTKKPEGKSTRYKARLVAKGYNQQYGVDFNETFAPVLRSSSIKLLLSYAVNNDLEIHHVDVKNAYLNAPLKDELYIEQPFGYERKDKSLVCKLHKAMYGLKQAARCWNELLHSIMGKLGLQQFGSEECIYATKGNVLVVGAYVDDLLNVSSSEEAIENFKRRLAEQVKITDKGELTRFLGMDVKRINILFKFRKEVTLMSC